MMKKLLVPLLAVYLLTHTVGCTSSDVQDESDVAAADDESFAEEGESDYADGEEEEPGDESASADEESSEDGEEVADGEEADEELEQAEGSEGEGEEVADGEDGEEELEQGEEVADGEEATEDGSGGEGEEDLAMDEGNEESEFPEDVADETEIASTEAAPSDESLFTANNAEAAPAAPEPEAPAAPADDLFNNSSPVAMAPAPATYAPLQKIKDAPFERGGALLNRVYVAREGDTLKGISQKIYGSDRASDLKKWNAGVRNSPRIGEKIYYSSPRDPQDSSRMLTYYEDMGIAPQVHVTKEGDNIRELGKSLLGHGESWKELWSTNLDVASKGALPPGIELKYWPEAAGAAPQMPLAQNPPAPQEPPPMDPGMGGTPPTDPTMMAQNQMPPTDPTMAEPMPDPTNGGLPTDPSMATQNQMPDPMSGGMPTDPSMGQAQTTDPTMQPPTDPGQMNPPPVVAQPEQPASPMDADPVKKKAPAAADIAASEDTTMLLMVVGVALLLLVGVFIIMRKNRARQIDLSQTQV